MVGADQLGWRSGLALVGLGEPWSPPRALGLPGWAELRPVGPGPEEKAEQASQTSCLPVIFPWGPS